MLPLTIQGYEYFDEKTSRFGNVKTATIQLEHSLISLAEWEAKWKKPFLGKEEKTMEECIDYVRCMTVTQHVDPLLYNGLTKEQIEEINKYIEDPMTATWFTETEQKRFNRETITAEIIYYWMISLNIPFECRKWHLNRLLTLIRVCNIKNTPPKKKGHAERKNDLSRRWALNESRRKRLNSTG